MRWAVLLMLVMVGCSRSIEPLQPEPMQELRPNTYIQDLPTGVVRGEMIIRGTVTTSDSCGNFYQSMMVQDATGAIELRFAFNDVYSLYKRGEPVSVNLFDRKITVENGVLSVNIGSLALASRSVLRQGVFDPVQPRVLSISDIDSTLLGRYVELLGGSFIKGGSEPWAGEQRYYVGKDYITVYTSPFASFANELLPHVMVPLRGIVTIYKGKFQLKISSSADCS